MSLALKRVLQRHDTGCAIAAIAIVAKTSYNEVKKLTSKFHNNNNRSLYLSDIEMIQTLRRLGKRAYKRRDWDCRKHAILIFEWDPGHPDTYSHTIVWDPAFGGRFIDPGGRMCLYDWQNYLDLWKLSGKETIIVK